MILKTIAIIFVIALMLPFIAHFAMSLYVIFKYMFMSEDEKDKHRALLPYAWGSVILVIVGCYLGAN